MGTVTRSTGTATTDFGGFCASNFRGKINDCYSTGRVIYAGATDPTNKGFCGSVDTGSGYEDSGNFWDKDTSLQTTSAGNATGKTTAQMKDYDTFNDAGWDIAKLSDHTTETWYIYDGNDYPRLRWETKPLLPGHILRTASGVLVSSSGAISTKRLW